MRLEFNAFIFLSLVDLLKPYRVIVHLVKQLHTQSSSIPLSVPEVPGVPAQEVMLRLSKLVRVPLGKKKFSCNWHSPCPKKKLRTRKLIAEKTIYDCKWRYHRV